MTKIGDWMSNWEATIKKLRMPNDLVVVRYLDADEAGDYRVMTHAEAISNPGDWWIMEDMVPSDLD